LHTGSLLAVTRLLEEALPAELGAATEVLIRQINDLSAASGDVVQLVEALPPLINIARYGNVRKTDSELVIQIVTSMIVRICIGLPNAVSGISDDAAQSFLEHMGELQDAVSLLQVQDITRQWQQTLLAVSDNDMAAPVLAGFATRLLSDTHVLDSARLVQKFHFHMSPAGLPSVSAAWLEGFLRGSGTVLLIDDVLWTLVNQWVASLAGENFEQVLPLLRRTFAAFTPPERTRLGEKVKAGGKQSLRTDSGSGIDEERGKRGIPVVLKILGIPQQSFNA
jgi:hypothetical protein